LHQLRNRVAHHEPLLTTDVTGRLDDLLTVAEMINPELGRYRWRNDHCHQLVEESPMTSRRPNSVRQLATMD